MIARYVTAPIENDGRCQAPDVTNHARTTSLFPSRGSRPVEQRTEGGGPRFKLVEEANTERANTESNPEGPRSARLVASRLLAGNRAGGAAQLGSEECSKSGGPVVPCAANAPVVTVVRGPGPVAVPNGSGG
jgi:hypothetical protein